MRRGLICHQIRHNPPSYQLRVHFRSIANQPNRKRLPLVTRLAHLVQRLIQRTRHLITIPRRQTSSNMLPIHLHRQAHPSFIVISNGCTPPAKCHSMSLAAILPELTALFSLPSIFTNLVSSLTCKYALAEAHPVVYF